MVFNTGAALLDAIVLAVVSKEEEGTYGYKITDTGEEKLTEYRFEWVSYSSKITELFSGEESENE